MSKYVSIKDMDGRPFSHTFSREDWRDLCTLSGQRRGRVQLSEGTATIDDGCVSVTLKSPGGSRIYLLSASELFD